MTHTVTIMDEVNLFYEDKGSGDPVIFIPGWTCTTEFFQHNLDAVAKNYRAISYDPRSQGNSSVTELDNNFAQRGKDLDAFIKALNLKNVTLAGWSLGAYDAYSYFSQFGTDNIKAFISIDMPPKGIQVQEDDWAEDTRENFHQLFSAIMIPDQRHLMRDYAQYMILREANDDELNWVVNQSLKTPAHIAALLIADVALIDYSDLINSIDNRIPVMHIIRKDWSKTALGWLSKQAPAAQTAVLGGHMMFWEFPDQFNPILLDFLAKL